MARLLRTLAVLLVFGLTAGWLMSGALFSGGQRVVGASDTETWAFLWGHGWMMRSVLVDGRFPFRTDLLDFPVGGVLWLKDPLTTLLVLPLQVCCGLSTAFSMAGWLLFTLAGVGFYLLARSLDVRASVATAAGLTFAFCPHSLGEAFNANLEALDVAWCGWWLWALIQGIRHPAWWRVLLGGVVLMALLVGNQYFGLAMAAVSAPLGLVLLWRERHAGHLQSSLVVLVGMVVLGGLLFVPWVHLLWTSLAAPDQLTLLEETVNLGLPFVADLKHLVQPLAPLAHANRPPPFQDIVYPGFIVFSAALLAPWMGAPCKGRWAWPLTGVVFLVLALGPAVMLNGRLVLGERGPIYLPWAYLVGGVPLLERMSLPHRLAAVAALFLSLGLALTAEGLARRLRRWSWAALLVPLLAFTEILLYPPYSVPLHTVDVSAPAWAQHLAALPDRGAVLDLPFKLGNNAAYRYLYWQTIHGRPIAASLRHGPAPSVATLVPWLKSLADYQRGQGDAPAPEPSLADHLRSLGFGFVVLHEQPLVEQRGMDEVDRWRQMLAPALGEGVPMSDSTRIYALSPAGSVQAGPGGGAP